jgi:hypothetical protein
MDKKIYLVIAEDQILAPLSRLTYSPTANFFPLHDAYFVSGETRC